MLLTVAVGWQACRQSIFPAALACLPRLAAKIDTYCMDN